MAMAENSTSVSNDYLLKNKKMIDIFLFNNLFIFLPNL